MKRILTAVVLIPLVLALVFLGRPWMITLFTAVLAALAAWEFLGMAARGGPSPPRIAVFVAIAALFVGRERSSAAYALSFLPRRKSHRGDSLTMRLPMTKRSPGGSETQKMLRQA